MLGACPGVPPNPTRVPSVDDFWHALAACGRDRPRLLRTIARRVVDVIGDGCVLTSVTEDGTELRPDVVLHVDHDVAEAMRAVLGSGNVRIGEGIAGSVAADRHPVLMNDLPLETVTEATPERFLPFVREHPMRALMIVPLVTGESLLGTLGVIRTSSTDGFTSADLHMLEALADRAALAIADASASPSKIEAADYEAAFRYSLDGILITVPDGHILAANPAACVMLRMTEQEIVAGGRQAVVVAEDPNLEQALAARAAVGYGRSELRMRRGDGTTFIADVATTIFATPDGRQRATVSLRDISDDVHARERLSDRLALLEEMADRDPLTGLLNRRGFAVACDDMTAAADRQGQVCRLLFVDVDRLKAINDTEGHSAGDAALVAVASAIERAVRADDVTARLGGDEFVVVTCDATEPEVASIVDRIRRQLRDDPDAPAGLSLSIGVTERRPHDARSLDELIDEADRDMYQERMLRRLRDARRRPGT